MQFESRMEKRLWKVQSRFYPGDLMTRTGDREIRSVPGRLPDNPGELACMHFNTWSFDFALETKVSEARRMFVSTRRVTRWILFCVFLH